MGQKVHPIGLRVGIIKDWDGRWYAGKKEYSRLILEDVKVRDFIKKRLYASGISQVEIERAANRVKVTIHTARPGMVIGRQGNEVENIRKDLEKLTGKKVQLNIAEVKSPELNAQLVSENIAFQLERRTSYRRAMKQAISRAMKFGAQGVKVNCSGRLMGAEIARNEQYSEGKVPLHTLRADIDYGFAEANTTYGKIGVKVWIYKGEILQAARKVRAKAEGGI
ncbi:MAG: 30S ribosomal protein S3 [Bacillota bacterium]|jgi:small subunit ribosomal protein S3